MKKKYVITALCLIVIALVIACGQIFTVRSISVVFFNKTGICDEAEVLQASKLAYKSNIFNVKEKAIIKNVAEAFPDNSIAVISVERKFPDKVIINVKERVPVFKIKVNSQTDDDYVATDKDFQRGTIKKESEITARLIEVDGFEVKESFDVKECIALRAFASSLVSAGLSEEALPYFVERISINGDSLEIKLCSSGAVMHVGTDKTSEETTKLYKEYLSMSISERKGAVLRIQA